MKKRVFRLFAVTFLWFCAALAASALEDIPVYGPARVAVEDPDLLAGTVLEVGVLAVTPDQPYRVVIGDGITPGGIPIHPEGCVTQFNQIANATTNLNMHSYSITFGPWAMSGGLDEFGLTWGGSETWLRLVRDTGIAYLSYDFTIIDPAHYRFELVWTGEGYDFPVLMVSTNLLQGYAAVDPDDVTYSRPDVSHLVVEYSVPGDYEFLGFRFFAPDRMKTGAYFGVPVHADYGLAAVGSLSVTGRVESYYDETAEENRDRYVPGSITIDGEEVATTGAVAAVAADLAAHTGNTANPHGVTAAQTGALPAAVDDDAEDEAYVVEHPTRFSWPLAVPWVEVAADAEAEEDEYGLPSIETPFSSLTNNGLAMFNTSSRSFGYGLALHSPYTFLRIGMGERSRLVFSREVPRGAEKALLEADDVTIKSGVYDEEEDEWVPGQILLDGHATVYGDTLLDGNAHVEGGLSVVEDAEFGGAVSAQSLTIGTGTTTNLSELATAASVSAVSDRVGDIEDDYLTSEDAAGFATTGAVASVERRLDEVETLLDEYWCTWAATKLADGVENWIPTNWPARKVWCCLYINRLGNFTISMPNWTPPAPCELHLLVRKQAGTNSVLVVKAPDGTTLASSAATSASSRVCEFYYHPATGWITGAITWSQSLIPIATLPDDTTFLPTTDNPIPSTLSTPSLQSLRPSLSSSAPLALGATSDTPDALEDLAPGDAPDDNTTDPDAVPDAIDHQEESSNLEFEDFAAFDDPADESEAAPEPEESR